MAPGGSLDRSDASPGGSVIIEDPSVLDTLRCGGNLPDRPIFELRHVTKTFPGVRALDDVSMSVWAGEIHMLLGENGAGKSTLMKVLCGACRADAGEFLLDGVAVQIRSPAQASAHGVAVIFQEFSLVPHLDVAQNMFLGREFRSRVTGLVDRRRLYQQARQILGRIGCDIDPHTQVHRLGVAQQQMVEIAKALSKDARILVMDEPTAALSDRETEALFSVMHQLKARGVAIVYISHRMAEVFALGDRITVLRDGRNIASMRPQDTTPNELVHCMVGRAVDMSYPRTYCQAPGPVALSMHRVSAATGIKDISLDVRCGEIVGLCGLVGSGRSEVARAVFGADPISHGEIFVFNERRTGGPDQARRQGVALIPEGRKTEGLALSRSVGDNMLVCALDRMFPNHIIHPRQGALAADAMIQRLRIATPSANTPAGSLSGGNQQKIVIGKWLLAKARLFLFDEPTRGIDVGSKAEIFALMDALVQDGAAVLMISSEQSEIVHVCDRAYVMRDGRIAGSLSGRELSEANIVRLAMRDE